MCAMSPSSDIANMICVLLVLLAGGRTRTSLQETGGSPGLPFVNFIELDFECDIVDHVRRDRFPDSGCLLRVCGLLGYQVFAVMSERVSTSGTWHECNVLGLFC